MIEALKGMLLLFVAVPVFLMALVAEITLIMTAIHRFIQWVERKWWS